MSEVQRFRQAKSPPIAPQEVLSRKHCKVTAQLGEWLAAAILYFVG